MSRINDFILDVQERYVAGHTPEQIAEATGAPMRMVLDAIEFMDRDDDDWPEPDSDF